jgi:hypothetical protein
MSLVIAGVTAPYQPQVEGLTVLWGDIDGAAGKGVVENSILDPATGGWMYDIRLANGDLIRTSPTVRILLVNGLAEDEPEPTPTPVPTATPTPVPTPTPEPTATPEAPADESEAPTPTPTPVPPEEEPTTTPTSEPEEEPTPAPGPDEEQDTITKPMPEPVILYHRVPVIEEYNQGAATEYIFNTFTLSGEDPDCCSPISSIDGGLVVTGDSVRWYVRASYNEYATQLDEPAIECHRGTRLWPWRFDGTMEFLESGCLGDPNDLVGLDYPHNMRITRYSGGETFSNEQTSTWTIEVEDSDGAYHSLGTIEFGFREDEPVEMRTDSGTSSCKDLNEDALGNRYPFSCSELGLKNSTPKPDEEESTTEQVEEGEEEETTSDSTPESEESEKEPEDETAPEPEPEKYLTLTRDLQVREFIQGVTGSQYIFSSVTAVYKVVNDADQQHITVGLVAEPDEAKPRWYVSSSSESGDRNVRCIEGSAIWESNIDDDETQGGGCIGDADFLAFDTPYTIEITPFSESDDDGWSVLINGTHVADIVDDDVDHSEDSFLRDYPITNAYSCTELSGYPPRSDCS